MLYMILVFGHLLATSMALGAIVATDLRMLSKLGHEKVRIPPPNEFVARIVSIALLLLYATGTALLWMGARDNPDYLTPKLQGKILLVLLLTFNAVVLHRVTFPRLARGRNVRRWRFIDWLVIVPPVALSNCLWMYCAFLGIARPWNTSMPLRDILEVAAVFYALALVAVGLVLAAAARPTPKDGPDDFIVRLKRSLAAVGNLGKDSELPHESPRTTLPPGSLPRHPRSSRPARVSHPAPAANAPQAVLRETWLHGDPRRRRA
jgi:hypothetical protein